MASMEISKIQEMRKDFLANDTYRLRMNAVTSAGIDSVARSYLAPTQDLHSFSLELPTGKVTSQNQTGRCWLFAATNVLRIATINKLNLKNDFELSQAYLFFWDKFEKANYFLENILSTLDAPTDGRLLNWLLSMPFNDGGQWDMFVGLVQKYGIVPKTVMPDTAVTTNSRRLDSILTVKGREFAKILRDAYQNGESTQELAARKEKMMEEYFRILCICMGTPPETFSFEIRNKDKEFTQDTNITPVEFYEKYVGINLSDYVSLINAPTQDKPYYRTFTVSYLGSVIEGSPVRYLNLPIEEMKAVAIKQLQDGETVWFGSDVGQMLDSNSGLMSMDMFQYDTLFSTTFGMDKAARLDYSESLMTHAMVITGVNLVDGTPNRWKVENSWGEDMGQKGRYRMTDDWFSEYVYQVVVHKKHLTDAQLKALDGEDILLKPWDPMGSLASMK